MRNKKYSCFEEKQSNEKHCDKNSLDMKRTLNYASVAELLYCVTGLGFGIKGNKNGTYCNKTGISSRYVR